MGRDPLFRLRSLLRRSALDRELDDEVRFHLERQVEAYIAQGIPQADAEARARREFGGVAVAKEDAREARGVAAIDTLFRDVRYGLRVLAKSPGFTAVATLSLALGIGANTAIFTLLDAIRLRTLPVSAPEELAQVHVADMDGARGSLNRSDAVTYTIWEQIRQRQESFSGIFAWADGWLNLAPGGEVRMERNLWVSGSFFKTLGIEPVAGRLIEPEDDRRGCGLPGAVISYPFWKREFGGEASAAAAVGRKLTLNGRSVEIIGVTPPGFFGLDVGQSFSVALPVCSVETLWFNALDAGTFWWLTPMGRLKPGATPASASAQLAAISPAIFQTTLPAKYPRVSVSNYLTMKLKADPAASGVSGLRKGYTEPLRILLGIAGFVLLIACANLANLMLARASVRAREIAVRLAIGASRQRLVAQLMVENLMISAAGAAGGLLLAREWSRVLVTQLTTDPTAIYLDLHPDWRVFAFTACLAIVTCLLFGLAPAMRATASGPGAVLKQSGRGMAGSQERHGTRRLLAAVQVALSLVLLVGALLFTGSLRNLLRVDIGFQTEGIIVADLGFARLTPVKGPLPEYQRALLERVAAVPGVSSAAATTVLPLSGASWSNRTWRDGFDESKGTEVKWARVSPGYFHTLGVPILAGRDFAYSDTVQSPLVAIVSREFARRVMKSESPLGMRFRVEATPSSPELVYEVVGISGDTKYASLREGRLPLGYMPMAQDPSPRGIGQLVIRSAVPPGTVTPGVRRAIAELDPGARFAFSQMRELIDQAVLRERLMARLSIAFALLAGVLAAIGLYGVMAYTVTTRTNEIGVRMALGAGPGQIVRMVLGESGRVVAIGIVAGSAISVWVTGFARALLFGVHPGDAGILSMAACLLGAVALLAAWVPARRAARLDPTVALREE